MSSNSYNPQMRAWTYTSGGYPSSLALSSLSCPPPLPPGPGAKLLVRVTAAALNPVDMQLMNLPLFTPSRLPCPLSLLGRTWPLAGLAARTKGVGADFAGEVLAAQDEAAAAGFAAGERVFGLAFAPGAQRGTLSEAIVVDVRTDVVVKTPGSWGDAQAASLPLVWLTARTCVQRCVGYVDQAPDSRPAAAAAAASSNAGQGEGEEAAAAAAAAAAAKTAGAADGKEPTENNKNNTNTVVVLGGSSATGMYSVLLAASRGWRVVATCSRRNAAFVRSMGACETIDYTAHPSAASLRAAVAAHRPAAVVDCVGGTDLLGIQGVRRYVTIVGDKTSRSAMGGAATYLWNPRMAWRALASAWLPDGWPWWTGAREEKYACVNLETRTEWLEEAVRVLGEDGRGPIAVDSVFPFKDVDKAFERLDSGRCRGKVVVDIPGSV